MALEPALVSGARDDVGQRILDAQTVAIHHKDGDGDRTIGKLSAEQDGTNPFGPQDVADPGGQGRILGGGGHPIGESGRLRPDDFVFLILPFGVAPFQFLLPFAGIGGHALLLIVSRWRAVRQFLLSYPRPAAAARGFLPAESTRLYRRASSARNGRRARVPTRRHGRRRKSRFEQERGLASFSVIESGSILRRTSFLSPVSSQTNTRVQHRLANVHRRTRIIPGDEFACCRTHASHRRSDGTAQEVLYAATIPLANRRFGNVVSTLLHTQGHSGNGQIRTFYLYLYYSVTIFDDPVCRRSVAKEA